MDYMDKISFEKIEEDLIVKLHTSDSFKKFRKIPNIREDIITNHTKENRQYTLPFENFFSKNQKAHSLKRELTNDEKFVIEYEHRHDSLKFFYSGTRDTSELIHDLGHVSYGIGKETIIEVRIKNLTDFLEKENEVITEKCLINNEEKEIIRFYLDVLRRYEKSFSGENKDKVSNAKTYLDIIYSEFPLINESYINVIGEVLEGIEFSELEECAESIKDMQRKIIRLTCLEKEPLKDKTKEYKEKYRSNRGNLTGFFDDEEIDKIPEIEKPKIVEVRNQIVRVRKILEIRYKYAPVKKKQKIRQYIKVIKNFETKKYFTSEEDKVSTFKSLLDILEGAEGISTLITGIPLTIIGSIVKIIKSILALNDLKKEYKIEKEEKKEQKIKEAATTKEQIEVAQAKRVPQAQISDVQKEAKKVLPLGNAEKWLKHPNRYDVRGVDTPDVLSTPENIRRIRDTKPYHLMKELGVGPKTAFNYYMMAFEGRSPYSIDELNRIYGRICGYRYRHKVSKVQAVRRIVRDY